MTDFSISGVLRNIWKNTCSLAASVKRGFDAAVYEQPREFLNGKAYILADDHTVREFQQRIAPMGPYAEGLDFDLRTGMVRESTQTYLQSSSGFAKELWHVGQDERPRSRTDTGYETLQDMGIKVARQILDQHANQGMGVPAEILGHAKAFLSSYDPSYKSQIKPPSFTA